MLVFFFFQILKKRWYRRCFCHHPQAKVILLISFSFACHLLCLFFVLFFCGDRWLLELLEMTRDAQSVPTWFSCMFFVGIVGCLSCFEMTRALHNLCPLDSLACSAKDLWGYQKYWLLSCYEMTRDAQSVPTWFSCMFFALWGLLGCLSCLRWQEMHNLCPLDSLACSFLCGDCWLLELLEMKRDAHYLCPLDSLACSVALVCVAEMTRDAQSVPTDSLDVLFLVGIFWLLDFLLMSDFSKVNFQWYWQCCLSLSLDSNRQQQNRDWQQTYCLNKHLKATADFSAAQANLDSWINLSNYG